MLSVLIWSIFFFHLPGLSTRLYSAVCEPNWRAQAVEAPMSESDVKAMRKGAEVAVVKRLKLLALRYNLADEQQKKLDYITERPEQLRFLAHIPEAVAQMNILMRETEKQGKKAAENFIRFVDLTYSYTVPIRFTLYAELLTYDKYGKEGNPDLKQITEWFVMDLKNLEPRMMFAFLFLLYLPASLDPAEGSLLARTNANYYTLADHPQVREWLNDSERWKWLFEMPDSDFSAMIVNLKVEGLRNIALPFAIALSRTRGGVKIAKRILSIAEMSGPDSETVDAWFSFYDKLPHVDDDDFSKLAVVYQTLIAKGERRIFPAISSGELAISSELVQKIRDYVLDRMPKVTEEERMARGFLWALTSELGMKPHDSYRAMEAVLEEDSRVGGIAAVDLLNQISEEGHGVDDAIFLKMIPHLEPYIEQHDLAEIIGKRLNLSIFPAVMELRHHLSDAVVSRYLNKLISAVSQNLSKGQIEVTARQKETLLSMVQRADEHPQYRQLAALVLTQQADRPSADELRRLFEYILGHESSNERLHQWIREAYVTNFGYEETLQVAALHGEWLHRYLRLYEKQLQNPVHVLLAVRYLLRSANQIEASLRVHHLQTISRWSHQFGLWSELVENFVYYSEKDADDSDFTLAAAIYFSPEAGRSGIRNELIKRFFDEGRSRRHPYCLIVDVKEKPTAVKKPTVDKKPTQAPVVAKAPTVRAPSRPHVEKAPRIAPKNESPVDRAESVAELLDVLAKAKTEAISRSAITKLTVREDFAVDWLDTASIAELFKIARNGLDQKSVSKNVAQDLFFLVHKVIEESLDFDLDDSQQRNWEHYYRAFTKQMAPEPRSVDILVRWLGRLDILQLPPFIELLASVFTKKSAELPGDYFFESLRSWQQSLGRATPVNAALGALVLVKLTLSKEWMRLVKRGEIVARNDEGRVEMADFLKEQIAKRASASAVFFHDAMRFSGHRYDLHELRDEADVLRRLVVLGPPILQFHDGGNFTQADATKQRYDEASLLFVMHQEIKRGRPIWALKETDAKRLGYDLIGFDPEANRIFKVILKSGYRDLQSIDFSHAEWELMAKQSGDDVLIELFDVYRHTDGKRLQPKLRRFVAPVMTGSGVERQLKVSDLKLVGS